MRRKSNEKTLDEIVTYGYMPERFTTGYLELVRLALKTDIGAQQFDNESGTVKKKYHQHAGGLKDERALRFKAWVDRQLRAIGRDVQAYLNARDGAGPSPIGMPDSVRREIARDLERKTELKCHGCGKYISWQWNHCAWCGKEVHGKEVSRRKEVGSNGIEGGGESEQEASTDHLEQSPGGTGEDVTRADGGTTGHDIPRATGTDDQTSVGAGG